MWLDSAFSAPGSIPGASTMISREKRP